MTLKSARFANNARLQLAAKNNPPLSWLDCGKPVRLLQQGLIDLGFRLPISTKRYGSPDGIYGPETVAKVVEFQKKYSLKVDGLAGRQTLNRLDALLPIPGEALPALPPAVPYQVPGLIDTIQQPTGMVCWATSYTMLLSWKRQKSTDIRTAVTDLGDKWLNLFDANKGLSPYDTLEFAREAGLRNEPLKSFNVDGWGELLRDYGPLWLVYGWQVVGANGLPIRGRHAIIVTGLAGDGTPNGTSVRYIDPGDGQYHVETFAKFVADYETGFTVDGAMTDQQLAAFTQIVHF